MEFLEGVTLKQSLQAGAMEAETIIKVPVTGLHI